MRERARLATARGSKSFYFATRFFPREVAEAAWRVYWFCRTTDDMVDEAESPPDLGQWRRRLEDALAGRAAGDEVLDGFAETVRRFRIPPRYAFELIDGVEMDLVRKEYENFGQLRLYCYRVASTVGLMMMHVIGFEGDPRREAIDLGIAMQLTNILRDVGEDLRRGRLYLPLEELRRFGLCRADLDAGRRDDRFRALMQFQIARARRFYESGRSGLPCLHPRGRFAVDLASRIYAGILGRIESSGYDVFARRAVVPRRAKYWIAFQAACSNAVSAVPALPRLFSAR
ncbi:MAG: phytoene/squalene synthase family protein [Bryobacteraceae bacterium]|nr:phytoene/squalene synthase family protein [Bryobacteraceae bacterium]